MNSMQLRSGKIIMKSMLLYSLAFIIAGLFAGNMADIPGGLIKIFTSPAPLATDFAVMGGFNAALFNAGLMGLCVLALYRLTGLEMSGGVYGAFFLSVGLGLFGKTPVTLAPFVLGGWLYSLLKKEPYRNTVLYPIQAAALSPVVTVLAFHGVTSKLSIILGFTSAVVIGFIITPVATHTRTMHKGFDLYNVGLAAGLIGIAFFAIFRECVLVPKGLADSYLVVSNIGRSRPGFFFPFLGGLFAATAAVGWVMAGCTVKPFFELRKHTGLDVDFVPRFGMAAVLMNMGFVGLMSLCYMWLIKAPMNGITAGALLCVLCWTGTGANTRNMLPVLVGHGLFSLILDKPLNTQYLCVSVCYSTGLAPLSGKYGGICGILAGMVHAFLSGITANMHGGFNLYNGGFSSGLTTLILLPVMQNFAKREYNDVDREAHPGLVAELAEDAMQIAHSAAHLVEHDPEIVQDVPESTRESKTTRTFLDIRNILAVVMGAMFIISMMPLECIQGWVNVLRFAAYIVGAGAYGAEIIVLTDGLRRDPGIKEMLMPYILGVLYIMLGLSYLCSRH